MTEQFIRKELGYGLREIKKPIYLFDNKEGLRIGNRQSLRLAYADGIGGMARQLANKLTRTQIHLSSRVDGMQYEEGKWAILTKGEKQVFDVMVVAVPFPSICSLLPEHLPVNPLAYTHQLTATF